MSILKTPKLKVKDKHITIVNESKIHIEPYDDSKEKMSFVMHDLKNRLPRVIIKGIPSITRAVINNNTKDKKSEAKYELAVEGYGLSEVMRTPGVDFR